jgi:hypothetical protein
MAENDQRPLALLGEVHLNAVGIDESVVYCCHGSSPEACLFVFWQSLHRAPPLSIVVCNLHYCKVESRRELDADT